MGYERPMHRRVPAKKRSLGKDIDNRRFVKGARELAVPMKVLLLPHNSSFYGAASICNTRAGRDEGIVYWNLLLQNRHIILPIEKADAQSIRFGKVYFMTRDNTSKINETPDLSPKNASKLEFLVEKARKELKSIAPEIKAINGPLKGVLRKAFPQEYVDTIETYFSAVKYANASLMLPVDQNT